MTALTEQVLRAWEGRPNPSSLATVDEDGTPNVIWVTCVHLLDDGRSSGRARVAIADNYFHKTLANMLRGSRGSLLFRSKDDKPYQLKGEFEYHTEGEIFEGMKAWNHPNRPGKGMAVLLVDEVYSGPEKIC
jgi:uncharacterized protein